MMERMLNTNAIRLDARAIRSYKGRAGGKRRCSICARRLSAIAYYVTETPEQADEPRSWLLCPICHAAVAEELDRAGLHTSTRLRVAVGLVASVRNPATRPAVWSPAYWRNPDDEDVERVLFWTIIIVAFGHMVVFFVALMSYVVFHP
ncbi:MAG: hypothetical protein ABI068_08450 [Ktedonobacterales bacterium]